MRLPKVVLPAIALIALATAGYAWLPRTTDEILALDSGPLSAGWLVPDEGESRLTAYLVVQSGEIDNTGPEGLAHYVEHLAWLSAREGDARAQDRHSNAWTSAGATVYWLSTPTGDLAPMLASLARVLRPIDLPQSFMEEERGIVRRERDMTNNQDPLDRVSDGMARALHADDPRRRSVIGTNAEIASFTPAEAMTLHDATHVPGRAVLIVTGDVSARAAETAIAAAFDGEDPGTAAPTLVYRMAAPERDIAPVTVAGLAQKRLFYSKVVALKEPVAVTDLMVRLDLLYGILDSRLPGGLAKALRYDARIARGYSMWLEPLDDSHIQLTFDATPDTGVDGAEVLSALETSLNDLAAKGIPSKTFDRIKARQVAGLDDTDDPADFTRERALALVQMRQAPAGHAQVREALDAIDAADLIPLLDAIAGEGRVVARLVRPSEMP